MSNIGKQIPQSQLMPNQFQPKQRHRFIVDFDGIDSYIVKKIELPTLRPNNGVLHSNMPAKLYLHCPVMPSTEKQIQAVIRKQAKESLANCIVKFLDPIGTVTDEWTFNGVKVMSVKFTSPDYNTSELMECIVLFTFSGVEFN